MLAKFKNRYCADKATALHNTLTSVSLGLGFVTLALALTFHAYIIMVASLFFRDSWK